MSDLSETVYYRRSRLGSTEEKRGEKKISELYSLALHQSDYVIMLTETEKLRLSGRGSRDPDTGNRVKDYVAFKRIITGLR